MNISGDASGISGGASAFSINQAQKSDLDSKLVSKTLDTFNTNPDGSQNADIGFQKSVLQGGFSGKGGQIDKIA